MRHNLPTVPIFRDTPNGSQIEELVLRVVVELPNWELHIIGTATLIGTHLALTAKHVLADALKLCNTKSESGKTEVKVGEIKLLQVLPGPIYRFWNVKTGWITSSDIAVLHLASDRTSDTDTVVAWRCPGLRATPPPSGEKVIAFGYRQSTVNVTMGDDRKAHIGIQDKPTTSAGVVGQIFPVQRDSGMLNFPCFEVHALFAHGMSGGLVIDEEGRLCGLVCASDGNQPPLSYAATLWPFLTTMISADRGDAYPRGVEYPAIDLALDGLITVTHLQDLNPAYFPGRALPGLNRMKMPTAQEFKMELHRMMYEAMQEGKATADINAGELHRRVGGYPGANHRMPVCCEVMRSAIAADAGDAVLSEPPSGQGASLTVRYVLPRRVLL